MNPRAPIKPVHFGQTPIDDILDIRGFNLNAILEIEPEFLERRPSPPRRRGAVVRLPRRRPFDGLKLEEFLSSMIQVYGNDLLRYKGVLALQRQSAPRGVPGRAHADGRRPRPAVGRDEKRRERHGVHRPQSPQRRFHARVGAMPRRKHSEETGHAGRQARAPHRGRDPQDAGVGVHERRAARVLPRPADEDEAGAARQRRSSPPSTCARTTWCPIPPTARRSRRSTRSSSAPATASAS